MRQSQQTHKYFAVVKLMAGLLFGMRTVVVFVISALAQFDFHVVVQKKLREELESHCLRKEEFINSVRRDKDTMDTIKVHSLRNGSN